MLPVQALALEANHDRDNTSGGLASQHSQDEQSFNADHSEVMTFYEITVASVDQPKLLSRLSEALVGVPSQPCTPGACALAASAANKQVAALRWRARLRQRVCVCTRRVTWVSIYEKHTPSTQWTGSHSTSSLWTSSRQRCVHAADSPPLTAGSHRASVRQQRFPGCQPCC